MGFGFANPIPAHATRGEDRYLILGYEGNGEVLVIDQDGDMRLIDYADLQTEWVYLTDLDVWFNRQVTLEDMEGLDEEDPNHPRSPASDILTSPDQPDAGEGGVPPDQG